jgi:hypothetical protein
MIGAMFTVATIIVKPNTACAQPTTPCDPEYMDALEARAWLEAQREVAQNQNLIVKPDSVLEYTCFDLFLNEIAGDAATMFSETTRWGPIPGLDATSQDLALQGLISTGLVAYITSNFPHTYLGGRATADGAIQGTVSGGDYACDQMATVWQEAKCLNMFDEADFDGFYDFQWYSTNDPRQLPGGGDFVACTPPDGSPLPLPKCKA